MSYRIVALAMVLVGVIGLVWILGGNAGETLDGLAAALMAAPLAVGLVWGQQRRSCLRDRLSTLRDRQSRLVAATLRLKQAGSLLPLLAGGPQVRAMTERFRAAMDEASRMSAAIEAAEADVRGWRLGKAHDRLTVLDGGLVSLERELHSLQAALRTLKDETHECLRQLAELRSLHAEILGWLCQREWGWTEDVWQELAVQASAIEEVERRRLAGDPVEALERAHGIHEALVAQQRLLEARQATMRWLESVPQQARGLAAERERLAALGYRKLPEVPVAALEEQAFDGIAMLENGNLEGVAEAQSALRHDLQRLRGALTGQEELRDANDRAIRALKRELKALEIQHAAIDENGSRERYPQRLWGEAASQQARFDEELRSLQWSLQAIENANALDTQRFTQAHEELARVNEQVKRLRHGLGQCQALWRALPQRERGLEQRLVALAELHEATRARAQAFGLNPDPGIEPLLVEVRKLMRARPLPLDEAEAAIAGAETALERFRARVGSLEERLEARSNGAAEAVWITRRKTVASRDGAGRRRP